MMCVGGKSDGAYLQKTAAIEGCLYGGRKFSFSTDNLESVHVWE
jgi:hypothetical protein